MRRVGAATRPPISLVKITLNYIARPGNAAKIFMDVRSCAEPVVERGWGGCAIPLRFSDSLLRADFLSLGARQTGGRYPYRQARALRARAWRSNGRGNAFFIKRRMMTATASHRVPLDPAEEMIQQLKRTNLLAPDQAGERLGGLVMQRQ